MPEKQSKIFCLKITVLSVAKNGLNPQFTHEIYCRNCKRLSMECMQRAIRGGVRTIDHGTLMDKETLLNYVPTVSAGEFV